MAQIAYTIELALGTCGICYFKDLGQPRSFNGMGSSVTLPSQAVIFEDSFSC